jgi:hypothetical protein
MAAVIAPKRHGFRSWINAGGAVAPVGAGFLGTTGSNVLLELDRRGRVTARLRLRGRPNHLTDFALDPSADWPNSASAGGGRPSIASKSLFDLEDPGASRRVPRWSGALDAVVVPPRG